MTESKKEKWKDKEICKDFYSKCRNYHRNLFKIEANRLKYDEVMNDMYGVSSAATRDIIMENAGDPSHVWDHCLIEKKGGLLLERAALLYDTVIVNKMPNNTVDDEVIDMVTECYIDRNKKYDDVAYNHNRSKPTMYSDMNRAVLSRPEK